MTLFNVEKYKKEIQDLTDVINGEVKAPEGYVIIGGKTGTTSAAGYCLLVMGKNAIGDKVIAVVMKASGRSDLYEVMKQMMAAYN